jgi:hypothetical protein
VVCVSLLHFFITLLFLNRSYIILDNYVVWLSLIYVFSICCVPFNIFKVKKKQRMIDFMKNYNIYKGNMSCMVHNFVNHLIDNPNKFSNTPFTPKNFSSPSEVVSPTTFL